MFCIFFLEIVDIKEPFRGHTLKVKIKRSSSLSDLNVTMNKVFGMRGLIERTMNIFPSTKGFTARKTIVFF